MTDIDKDKLASDTGALENVREILREPVRDVDRRACTAEQSLAERDARLRLVQPAVGLVGARPRERKRSTAQLAGDPDVVTHARAIAAQGGVLRYLAEDADADGTRSAHRVPADQFGCEPPGKREGIVQSRIGRHRDAVKTFEAMIDKGFQDQDFLVHLNLYREYETLGDMKVSQLHRLIYLQKVDVFLKNKRQ